MKLEGAMCLSKPVSLPAIPTVQNPTSGPSPYKAASTPHDSKGYQPAARDMLKISSSTLIPQSGFANSSKTPPFSS